MAVAIAATVVAERLRRRGLGQDAHRAQAATSPCRSPRRRSRPRSAWPNRPHLVIAVRNSGHKTIPNVAVTICNVTCAYPAPHRARAPTPRRSPRTSSQAGLASPSRPIWIVDQPPGPCRLQLQGQGGPGGAVTAYSNTWALGALAPGDDRDVRVGRHRRPARRAHRRLAGRGRPQRQGQGACWPTDRQPQGTFKVTVQSRPEQSYVNSIGQGRQQAVADASACDCAPDVERAVDRVAVDLARARRRRSRLLQRGDVLLELRDARGARPARR